MTDHNPNSNDSVTVELPAAVAERIEDRLPQTTYDTVDEYAAAALEGLLREVTEGPADPRPDVPDAEPAEGATVDDDAVEDRLSSLGYL